MEKLSICNLTYKLIVYIKTHNDNVVRIAQVNRRWSLDELINNVIAKLLMSVSAASSELGLDSESVKANPS